MPLKQFRIGAYFGIRREIEKVGLEANDIMRVRIIKVLFPLALILLLVFSVSAQKSQQAENGQVLVTENVDTGFNKELSEERKVPINIHHIGENGSINIDGKLDEPDWKLAAEFKDFIQVSPGDNIAASKPTKAYIMYDSENLYIAFRCWDDRDKIRATVAKRDTVFSEDNVRIWLDTFNDQRRAYILGWNPLGIQADGIQVEGQGTDFSLDIVMESKGVIEDWGWVVEVKIPFKSLRYEVGEGKMWGFDLGRNIDRLNDEFDSWMPRDRDEISELSQFGKLTGLQNIKTERTLEIVPSVTLSETGRRVSANEIAAGRFVNEPIKQDYGVTVKYSITPNVILDAAINPDFAEIEADAPVVRANQRFPIFFDEKRPFFLEGADIFNSMITLFHSRTIVDPDVATKVTGKIGKNSFGVLFASDNAPGNYDENARNDPNIRPFIDEYLDKNALFLVARGKRDYGNQSNVGLFTTARIFPENRNFVFGIDGLEKLSSESYFAYQLVGSTTRKCFFDSQFDDIANPDQAETNGEICGGAVVDGVQELGNIFSEYRTGNGLAYSANYGKGNDRWGVEIRAEGRSKDFRSEAGFLQRANTNSLEVYGRKSSKSNPDGKIIRANWSHEFAMNYDWDGRMQSIRYNTSLGASLQKNTFFNTFLGVEKEWLYEDEFGLSRNDNRSGAFYGEPTRSAIQPFVGVFFRSQPIKKLSFWANPVFVLNSFDLDFGAGRDYPRVSPAAIADSSAALDPGPGAKINLSYGANFTPIDPWTLDFSHTFSRLKRKDSDLVAFQANIFSFKTTYQFTRFIFARARIDYNTLSHRVGGQYLVGWTPSPGTAFYAGYNDNLNYNGYNPFTGLAEPGFERNRRTFFIRASYLFRKSF